MHPRRYGPAPATDAWLLLQSLSRLDKSWHRTDYPPKPSGLVFSPDLLGVPGNRGRVRRLGLLLDGIQNARESARRHKRIPHRRDVVVPLLVLHKDRLAQEVRQAQA